MVSSTAFLVVVLAVFSQATSSSLRVARDAPNLQELMDNLGSQLQTLGNELTKAIRGETGGVTFDDVKATMQEAQERASAFAGQVAKQLEMSESAAQGTSSSHRVARDAPNLPNLQELMDNVRTQLQTVGNEVTKAIRGEEGGVTADDVKAVVEAKTQEIQERARAFTEEVARQLESRRSEMSESTAQVLQQAALQVNASLERVQTLARDSPSAVDNFNESFKRTVETLVEENSKLARAAGDDVGAAHDQLATLSRNTLSQAMDLMRNFATEVNRAASGGSS